MPSQIPYPHRTPSQPPAQRLKGCVDCGADQIIELQSSSATQDDYRCPTCGLVTSVAVER